MELLDLALLGQVSGGRGSNGGGRGSVGNNCGSNAGSSCSW